ncbi:MAG: DUF4440 domain-containing protein [Alphaproteobacteria bacterium]|nr:DUF4440 domain-containing protein [Alphaproteobacteria bacterium]
MRNSIIWLSAALSFAATSAFAQTELCKRGDDARRIEVVMPGEVGQACDLRYTRGGSVETPYHADFSTAFCAKKASELVSTLVKAGFDCTADVAGLAPPELRAQADGAAPPKSATETLAEAPSPDGPLVPELPLQDDETEQAPPANSQFASAAPASPALIQPPADGAALAGGAGAFGEDLSAPAPEIASAGPVALAPSNASDVVDAPAPESEAVGRVLGPAPDERLAESAVSQTAKPAVSPGAARAEAPAASDAPKSGPAPQAATVRSSAEIVKSVLRAQAAAWNEGDLAAFMNIYWNSPKLVFIDNGDVTTGWDNVMKRYKDRYGSGDTMGQLALDGVNVAMVSDDVAIADGRFRLSRKDGAESGSFSIVMRRFDGLWRIVHDNSSADRPPTE